MARVAKSILNKFGAPGLSDLTECGALPMEEAPNYLGVFVMNNLFHFSFPDPSCRIALMFGRRVEHAIREYIIAQKALATYVERLPVANDHFLVAMRATTHFEQCVTSVCEAEALLKHLSEANQSPAVTLKFRIDGWDKAKSDRLRRIWNRSKHFDEDLVDNKLREPEITAPVWLTNSGIASTAGSVTFDELYTTLTELVSALKFISEDYPRLLHEQQKARDGTL